MLGNEREINEEIFLLGLKKKIKISKINRLFGEPVKIAIAIRNIDVTKLFAGLNTYITFPPS